MNVGSLSAHGYYWYLAGFCRGTSRQYLAIARHTPYVEAKKLYVNWARAEHHAAMRYARLAREAA